MNENLVISLKEFEASKEYWVSRIDSEICDVNIPPDFVRSYEYSKSEYKKEIKKELIEKLIKMSKGKDPALYIFLTAAFKTLLFRVTGAKDFCIGAPVHKDLESSANERCLLLRDSISSEMTYRELLKSVRQTISEAYKNQHYPIEKVLESIDPEKEIGLFKVIFMLKNLQPNVDFNALCDMYKSDILLLAIRDDDRFDIKVIYNSNIFCENTVKRLLNHYEFVLEQLLNNIDIKLKDVELVSDVEKNILLNDFNGTDREYEDNKTIVQLFNEQVLKTPQNTALVFGDQSLTYSELNEKADQLAAYLNNEQKIGPDSLVAILLEPGLFQITAILGVQKAGGAYIPIDPKLPEERIKVMLNDAKNKVLISGRQHLRLINRLLWECSDFETYILLDTDDIDSVEEERSELMDEGLWEHVGNTAVDDIEGGGWVNSYTGENLSKEEMDEYSQNILEKLYPYVNNKTRILEIGCASGLSMFKLAPLAAFYYGTDLSKVIIERNKNRVSNEGISNIRLECLPAHDIDKVGEKDFDIIIINSVIQCFSGHNYLKNVIGKCVDLIADKGIIFIGDIMDQDLKKNLVLSLSEFMKSNQGKGYRTKTDFSTELFVSRGYFNDLVYDIEEIDEVMFSDKIHTIKNELTEFRYDTILSINKSSVKSKNRQVRNKFQFDNRVLQKYKGTTVDSTAVKPDDLAYLIYTSGTSGKPKAVMVSHRSLVNLSVWHKNHFSVTQSDRSTQYAGLGFDASVWEIFPYIISGSSIHIVAEDIRLDVLKLNQFFEENNITISFLPTQICEQFIRLQNNSLRILLTGGDKLKHFKKNSYTLVNNYGPTENTVVTTSCVIDGESYNIPIGKPIWNTKVYILDKSYKLLPVGIAGELCISGVGVAKGYLNIESLTKEKFVKNPYLDGQIMYKTGDLARWLDDGSIEFLGRIDQQVKIRGVRLELEEIEKTLLLYDGVTQAVVIDRNDADGEKYLCAYYVSDSEVDISDIRGFMGRELPVNAIPAYFVRLESLPITPNGKIDKRKLIEPDELSFESRNYQPPTNKTEEKLVGIWNEVLGVKRIGINDSFFELGGHSLKATILVSKIHKEFDVNVPLKEVFSRLTVKYLAQYIDNAEMNIYASIKPVEKRDSYPVSSAQKRLYILDQFEGVSTTYNVPGILLVEGKLDKNRIEEVVNELIIRHDALRTSFNIIDDEPCQIVHDNVEFKVEYDDISSIYDRDSTDETAKEIIEAFITPFDLSKAPLLRIKFVKLEDKKHIFMYDMHHIISDGTSMGIIIKEFANLYIGKKLSEPKIQYKDFACWQSSDIYEETLKKQQEYWLNEFSGDIPVLNIHTDFERPSIQSFEGDIIALNIGKELAGKIESMSKDTGATKYMILLAAYNVLLSKYTGQEDIIVGSPIAGRPHSDLEGVIGMFVNTLALRNRPKSKMTFMEFLEKVKENCLSAFENQDYQFEELVEKLDVTRDISRNAIFDTMFVMQNMDVEALEIENLTFTPYEYDSNVSKFDLSLSAFEDDGDIVLSIEYCTKLFEEESIKRLSRHYINILKQITKNPNSMLESIGMLSEAEKKRILGEFNNTEAEYKKESTINDLFEEQVQKMPDEIAAIFEGESLTYCELNKRANQLANVLKEKGVKKDCPIALVLERSFEMIIGIMGVLKAGGAYLPIDPSYPKQRIDYMLHDSGAKILLTTSKFKHIGEDRDINTLYIDNDEIYKTDFENAIKANEPSNLAYIIYTSGSTGMPKGTMIEHYSVINRLTWMQKKYPVGKDDVILQKTPFTFDVSVWEMFWWSFYGAKVCFLEPGGEKEPAKIIDTIEKNNVTVMHFVPSMLNVFLEYIEEHGNIERLKTLKQVFASGEALTPKQVKRFNNTLRSINGTTLSNLYGPTEATVDVTYYDFPFEDEVKTVPIGKPIDNINLYIVDKNRNLQPVGVPGELCIAGHGLARGYLKRPELTKEKFVNNPFEANSEYEKMYRTGDLARWMDDGNIEFLGRIDHQVKIRGFRIELSEIEKRILGHESIKEAVVIDRQDKEGVKFICAYIVTEVETDEIKEYLKGLLPEYMVPSYFIRLDEMPLSANGKIDRKKLPEPLGEISSKVEYIPPVNETEEMLVKLFEEVLGVSQIGTNHNFFEIGGHSLKAAILVSKIHRCLNVDLPLRDIFKNPTISSLSKCILRADKNKFVSIVKVKEREFYPVTSAQKRVLVLDKIETDQVSYNMPGAVVIEGEFYNNKMKESFEKLIERHEPLRTSFRMDDDKPVQVIHKTVEFDIEYDDLSNEEDEAAKKGKIEEIIDRFIRPFDLEKAPLLRVKLIKLSNSRTLLVYDMHHIISDGVSMGIIIKEFAKLYIGEELPDLKIQYKDFACWQNDLFNRGILKKQEEFWLDVFSGNIPVLNLQTDFKRPLVQSFEGELIHFDCGEDLNLKLNKLVIDTGATKYMILLAAYNILLSKYSGQEDIVVGSPIAGRPHSDLESVIGMFVNTLALRNYPKNEITFMEFLEAVKENFLAAFENQDYQFEELIDKLNLQRDVSRNPLFDTMFVMQNMDVEALEIDNLVFAPYEFDSKVSKFDLLLSAYEDEDNVVFSMEYCTKLFKEESIKRLSRHYINILKHITENPNIMLKSIDILSDDEKTKILGEFNNTKAEYKKESTINNWFEEQVKKTPGEIAAIFEGKSLTYGELNRRANQLANLLNEKGVKKDSPIALVLERSFEMIIGIMGVLKAGGAYLPIDPSYPKDRIDFMMHDSEAKILLTTSKFKHIGEDRDINTLYIDNDEIYTEDFENPIGANEPSSLAYIIYTSGSTGVPKGTIIEHYSVINRLNWMQKRYRIGKDDVILQKTPFTFDVSVWEMFWWSFYGAKVCFLEPGGEKEPAKIIDAIEKNNITVMHFVPSMLNVFLEYIEEHGNIERLKSLKQVFASGEALTPKQVKRFNNTLRSINGTRLSNLYGPTEATVDVTYYDCPYKDEVKIVPIGKPIDNINLYIVDKNRSLQPIGVPGELCIAGDGLARGYLKRPELTKEKFVENPFEANSEYKRMYRTGDLARWMNDGNIEFLGRIDHQVKIRGFRIELSEIEKRILDHERVKEAVVIDKEDKEGAKYICAYIVIEGEAETDEIREYLKEVLPEYMVPSYFIRLDEMPLSANGKIDRKKLPEPLGEISSKVEYIPPANETEEILVKLFEEVLGVSQIGTNHNFFSFGGDSIKAIQISSRLNKYGLKIETRDLFMHPRIIDLSKYVERFENEIDQRLVEGDVVLTPIQRWYFDKKKTDIHHFNQAFLLKTEESINEDELEKVFTKIVEHHDALRMVFKIEQDRILQYNREITGKLFNLKVFDLKDEPNYSAIIERESTTLQQEMELNSGPLIRLGLFKTKDEDFILIAIHHLVIDGVSWRIIFEDMAMAYSQLKRNEEIRFQLKTNSFKDWAYKLQDYSKSKDLLMEREYWENITLNQPPHLPKDYDSSEVAKVENTGMINVHLSESYTVKLLNDTNRAYNTEINDILLCGLSVTLKEWTKHDKVLIWLEGHGRESFFDGINITRTVGWFTSLFPILITLERNNDISYSIKSTKEYLRHIPQKGIGYGILRYMSNEDICDKEFDKKQELCFNYLGQIDNEEDSGNFEFSSLSSGKSVSEKSEMMFSLEINSVIVDGKLSISAGFNKNEYKEETVVWLLNEYKQNLIKIIDHCTSKEDTELTPTDLGDSEISLEELDEIDDFLSNL